MEHNYISCHFDGEFYYYECSCGHSVKTTDGKIPIKIHVK